MALLTSTPVTVSVTSFPYSLPNSAGQVVSIGFNTPSSIRPSSHSAFDWHYAVFSYYGGGAFIESYSQGGAWAVAGSGGHDVPPNVDACIFDFQDAMWKRRANANGVAPRRVDFVFPGELSGGEIVGASPPHIPGTSHQYGRMAAISSAQGGGPRGSYLMLRGSAMGRSGGTGSGYAYAMDLDSGLWIRRSTNTCLNAGGGYGFRCGAYDPTSNRYYMLYGHLSEASQIDYLDGNDWTWKVTNLPPAQNFGGTTFQCFVDVQRNILIGQDNSPRLRALNLSNIAAGWQQLSFTGDISHNNQNNFVFYPPDGCYYHTSGGTNFLIKLIPPAFVPGQPFAGTWTFTSCTGQSNARARLFQHRRIPRTGRVPSQPPVLRTVDSAAVLDRRR